MSVARTYNNMAVVYDSQGHYEKALEYYQKGLDIMIKVVGHDHIDQKPSVYTELIPFFSLSIGQQASQTFS